jgi:amidophosphoribosyltransferase
MCGIFGIFGHPEAANIAYLGLHALQHRGQESAGIASADGEQLFVHRSMGRVQDGFSPHDLAQLPGAIAIGHVRYSTAGGSHIKNAQPIAVDFSMGSLAVAHNGNLTNHEPLRERLEARGSIFQSGSDTETIVHLIAKSDQESLEDRIADALRQVEGAYSIVILTRDKLIAVRDPMGIRPLCLGRMQRDAGDVTIVASEPTSFELIGAELVRDVDPGEMLIVDRPSASGGARSGGGVRSRRPFPTKPRRACLFEHVYFARPDATLGGAHVYSVRKALGRKLAQEHPLPSTPSGGSLPAIVTPVPDSGLPAAIGFAEASGIPFEMGLIRSHYMGRTFIEPQDSIRHFGVRLKLYPNRGAIDGRRVVVVDDSIVRGTTSRKIVKMLRDAGAREVHVRVSSPPTRYPCFYGIDTPNQSELIAATHTPAQIAEFLGADSIGYLSLEGLIEAVRTEERRANAAGPTGQAEGPEDGYCHACFSGDYPVPIPLLPPSKKLRLVDG